MNTLIQKVFDILTSSPENLIYHLVLAFAVMAALQTVLVIQRNSSTIRARRMMFGLAILLLGQLFLFLSSAFAWQGLANPKAFLPPLDRAVATLSIIWAVWLWAFPKPQRLTDALAAVLSLFVIIFLVATFLLWNRQLLNTGFNTSLLDTGWSILMVFLILAGLLALLIKRNSGWGIGASFLLLHLVGVLAHLFWGKTGGDYSAPLRLAMLCAYPLLPSLINHLQVEPAQPAPTSYAETQVTAPLVSFDALGMERRRYTADPRSSYTWLKLAVEEDARQIPYALARAIAQSLVSDLCILASAPPHGMINLESGFDLIQEEELAPAAMRRDALPALANALQHGETLLLNNDPASPDPGLHELAQTLGLDQPGNLMVVPILGEKQTASGILFMSPYSNRVWNEDDITYMMGISELIGRLLYQPAQETPAVRDSTTETSPTSPAAESELVVALSGLAAVQHELEEARITITSLTQNLEQARQQSSAPEKELQIARENLAAIEQQLAENETKQNALQSELAETRQTIQELQTENQTLAREMRQQSGAEGTELFELQQQHELLKNTLEQLKAENEDLRRSIQAARAEEPDLEAQFRMTLEETAQLKNALGSANSKIATLENQLNGPAPLSASDQKMIIGLGQELRQPLASIVGYSDLLLSEKTGILGALQHRLMLRVRQATQRMEKLLEEINAIINRSGDRETSVVTVDFNAIIDKTIARVGNALRDKDIGLRFDLPEDIPSVHVDEDSIEQVIFYLMQNAILATPKEGSISLHVNVETQAEQPHFMIQVTDSGGGIAMDDLPRVFSRTYLEDHPEISGLGDQGVGLSIAKTLTEAHKGRIWVESDPGNTTTFSVLFPFRLDEEEVQAG
jgi:signal transduction histidine kinase